ncbi:hypothetical protein E8E11_001786 [Didymella keratinophila]|nr:hypothetical protein E8E11_001786 [Didymella keratinophila]
MGDTKDATFDETNRHLYTSGDYSDITTIICSRSEFFKRAERFAVGKEAAENRFYLPENDPTLIKLMVQYMYEGDYDPRLPPDPDHPILFVADDNDEGQDFERHTFVFPHTCPLKGSCPPRYMYVCPHHIRSSATCNDSCVNFVCGHCCPYYEPPPKPAAGDAKHTLLHAQMYHMGDKYGVVGLKQLATEKFARACAKFWSATSFSPAVRYVFDSTPDSDHGLRDIAIKTISDHGSLMNKADIRELLNEFDGLAVAVLEAEECRIELPADDPTQIKLLMQYLYEAEYEPKLPASHTAHFSIEKMLLQPKDKVSLGGGSHLHYEFPHTCSQGYLGANQQVCQHHLCGVMICNGTCKDFMGRECCPDYHASLKALGGDLKKGESSQFLLYSQMYALAEKYQVDGLKELALEKVKWCCTVFRYTSDFLPAARHVFDDTTPEDNRGLRHLVTYTFVKHMEVLSKPDVWALVEENNDLSSHVLMLNALRLGFTAPEPRSL